MDPGAVGVEQRVRPDLRSTNKYFSLPRKPRGRAAHARPRCQLTRVRAAQLGFGYPAAALFRAQAEEELTAAALFRAQLEPRQPVRVLARE